MRLNYLGARVKVWDGYGDPFFLIVLSVSFVEEVLWVFVVKCFILGDFNGLIFYYKYDKKYNFNIFSEWYMGSRLFYLLIKIFDNKTLKIFSKYVIVVVLVLLFIHSVLVSI